MIFQVPTLVNGQLASLFDYLWRKTFQVFLEAVSISRQADNIWRYQRYCQIYQEHEFGTSAFAVASWRQTRKKWIQYFRKKEGENESNRID